MICNQCGKEITDNLNPCSHCDSTSHMDKGNIGFAILSFLFPIVGAILCSIWKDKKPKTSKQCLYAAIIGFALNIIILSAQILLR